MRAARRPRTRGAVLVEFLVAVMPLATTFFSFVQVAQIATAQIVVKHAAIIGARGGGVISNKAKNTPDQKKDGSDKVIEEGVKLAMGPWTKTMKNISVTVDDKSNCESEGVFEEVSVTVDADYKCSVPFGGFIVCGSRGGVLHIKQKFTYPHQGARYHDGGGADCAGEGEH